VGAVGLCLRAYAAGYLHKKETLTITGPYAYTRNPLYLGSAVLALGAGIATCSALSVVILLLYFAIFYTIVMKREEGELHKIHAAAFDAYARTVPLFFPRLSGPEMPAGISAATFSLAQYKKNHEWQAAAGFLLLLVTLLIIWHVRLH